MTDKQAPAEGAEQFYLAWANQTVGTYEGRTKPPEHMIAFAEAYADSFREQLAQARSRLTLLSFLVTGNDHALVDCSPEDATKIVQRAQRMLRKLPCGHDSRYGVEWRELRSYTMVHVTFCIACNYESVSKKIAEERGESGGGK